MVCVIPTLVESPFASDVPARRAAYRHYLIGAFLDCLERGEAPFASHYIYTGFLDDSVPVERAQGIEAGLAWGEVAQRSAFYVDLGLSRGMRTGLERAVDQGWTVLFRSLPAWAPETLPPGLHADEARRFGEGLPDTWL